MNYPQPEDPAQPAAGEEQPLSLERLRAGDRLEFARMVELYSARLFRLAQKILEQPQDAEDVLQETFLKAFRHLERFDGRSSLSTWLYRIATNEALMLLRRKRPTLSLDEPQESADGEAAPVEVMDWCCMPEVELMSAEVRAQLDRAVAALPESLRVVFLLRDLEGLSTLETGEVLQLSETAVKTRLSRARLRLREFLTGYFREQHGMEQASDVSA